MKTIVLAADHNGVELKKVLYEHLKSNGYRCIDLGPDNSNSVDYTDYAYQLGSIVDKKDADFGILICGSGTGMSIVANKHKNIRAALCYDIKSTKLSRLHNNANVMTIGSRLIKKNVALKCVNIFLKTPFDGGRHLRRIKKILTQPAKLFTNINQ